MHRYHITVALTIAAALAWAQGLSAQTTVTVGEGATVTLESGNGETSLKVENNATIDVRGKLRLQGTSADILARLNEIAGTGKYSVVIENGGELDANNFRIDNLNRNGIHVKSGGRILELNNGTFDNQKDDYGVYLNFADALPDLVERFETYTTLPSQLFTSPSMGSWSVTDNDFGGPDNTVIVGTESFFAFPGGGANYVIEIDDIGNPPGQVGISRTFTASTRGYAKFKIRKAAVDEYARVNLYNNAGATLCYTLEFGVASDTPANRVVGKSVAATDTTYMNPYAVSQWYTVIISWDLQDAADKWNVWIDGVHKGTWDWAGGGTFTLGIDKIEFITDENTPGKFYVEDVAIDDVRLNTFGAPQTLIVDDPVIPDGSTNPTGWTVTEPGAATVTVTSNEIVMVDPAVADLCEISRQIATYTANDIRRGFLEFRIKLSRTNPDTFSVKLRDTESGDFAVEFNSSGITGKGTGTDNYLTSYTADQWYKVRVEWEFSSSGDFWTAYVDDVQKGTIRWNSGTTNFTGIDKVLFGNNNGTANATTITIDDIKVGELYVDGSSRGNIAYSFSNITFSDSSSKSPVNAKASARSPVVWFLGGGGARWGPTYESDPYDRIRWSGTGGDITDLVKRYTPPTSFQDNHGSVAQAIAAAQTGDRVKINRNITLGDTVELAKDDLSKEVIVEGGFFIPMGGRYVGATYTPDRAASGYQELLTNTPLALDSSSNNYHGTVYDGAAVNIGLTTSRGAFSKALILDGTNDSVQKTDENPLDITSGGMTIEGWVKLDVLTGTQTIVGKGAPASDSNYTLAVTPGGASLTFKFYGGAAGNTYTAGLDDVSKTVGATNGSTTLTYSDPDPSVSAGDILWIDSTNYTVSRINTTGNTIILTAAFGGATASYTAKKSKFTINKWHHVALVHTWLDGASTKTFLDGALIAGSWTAGNGSAAVAANGIALTIGRESPTAANYLDGTVDEIRISSTARYSVAFTPSASAFSSDASTVVLYHFDGCIVKDTSVNGRHGYLSNTTGQNPTGTGDGKFGNALSFDGDDTVLITDNAALDTDFATADFTVEAWVYIQNLALPGYIIDKHTGTWGTNALGYVISYDLAQTFTGRVGKNGATDAVVVSAAISATGWYHVAMVVDRDTDIRLYVNGVQTTTATTSAVSVDSAAAFAMGSDSSGAAERFTGRIDEVRLSAGTNALRYTAAFTASALQPFTPDADTKVLYHFGETYITLRNSVVARGGLDVVKAQNCTLFSANSAWTLMVTESSMKNCIVENNIDTTSDHTTTCVTTWTNGANSFNNLAMLDYHLKAAGVAAIDQAERLDNIVYDAPFYEAVDIDATNRGFDGNGTPNNPVVGDWDIGADEFYADTKLATIGATEIGNVTRVFPAGTRNSEAISYAVLAGSSSNASLYDNRLVVLRNSDFAVRATSAPAPGAIVNMTYYRATTSPFRTWVFLVVDSDYDGLGDSIMALIDTGTTTLAADTAFDSDALDDGVQYWGSPIKTIASWRIATEGDSRSTSASTDPRYGRKLYFVAGQKFYKVNADPGDSDSTADGGGQLGKYGEEIWNSSARKYSANGTLNIDTADNVFVSVTSDSSTDVVVKMPYTGNSAPVVANSWKVSGDADQATVDENNNGQIIYAYQANTRILIAPSDGKRISATTTNAANDTFNFASEADTAGANLFGANVDSLPYRFFGKYYVLVGAGEKVYKILDTGSAGNDPADWKNPNGQGPGKNGAVTDADWPMSIKGAVTSRVMIYGSKIYFGTKDGYCYAVPFEGRDLTNPAPAGDDGLPVAGFPYRFPNQRVTDVFLLSDGVYFVTDQGMSIKVPLQ